MRLNEATYFRISNVRNIAVDLFFVLFKQSIEAGQRCGRLQPIEFTTQSGEAEHMIPRGLAIERFIFAEMHHLQDTYFRSPNHLIAARTQLATFFRIFDAEVRHLLGRRFGLPDNHA